MGHSCQGIHALACHKQCQLVAMLPLGIVLQHSLAESAQRGTGTYRDAAHGNVSHRHLVLAEMNLHAGQRSAGHLIASHHTSTLTRLLGSQCHTVGPGIHAHKLVVVTRASTLVLETGMEIPCERPVKVHQIGPGHTTAHLAEGTGGYRFLLHSLLYYCLSTHTGKSHMSHTPFYSGEKS